MALYEDPRERRSGRTTMEALNYVHLLLDNPGQHIQIDDHYQHTPEGDRELFGLVVRVLIALNVPHTTNKQRCVIRCEGPPNPYRYLDADECVKRNFHTTPSQKHPFI